MKNSGLVLLFVVMLATSIAAQEAAVRNVLTDYDNARNRKDVAAVSLFLTDDYVYFSSTGGANRSTGNAGFLVFTRLQIDVRRA